ncbi:MAG: T9SS type A sorting domain-containing protein [Ignavibacteria bacterium]|nr:T9SS type A sorting domain-containing protein [Ignavibacteria bacterium]
MIDRVVTYVPDTVTASKSKHDFGQQPSLVTVTDTLTIINPHTDRSVVVTDISMINNGPTFTLTSTATPFVLAAGASVNVIVSSRLLSDNTVRDTLVVRTECVDWKLTEYLVRAIGDTTTSVSGEAETPGLTFTITPQPIRDVATLTLTTIERGAASIELIDLLGNVITARTEQVTSSPQSFMIGGMNVPSGTYSVRVTASGRQATARIIIAH